MRYSAAFVLIAFIALELTAQVPAAQQAALFSRILAYDRNLKSRAGAQVIVGLIYKGDQPSSRAVNDEMAAAFAPLKARTIQELPFDVASLPYTDSQRLNEWVESKGIDVLYICPGLEAAFGDIQSVAARHKVVTLSPERKDVQQGVAIGVVNKDGKPGIVVNLTSARSLGMDLDPKLLQLAEVIR